MDWIRRNWLDLLIGLAFLAVISGIIITLFSGGSLFPNRNRAGVDASSNTSALQASGSLGANTNGTSVPLPTAVIPTSPISSTTGASSNQLSISGNPTGVTIPSASSSVTNGVSGISATSEPTSLTMPMIPSQASDIEAVSIEPASISVTPLPVATPTPVSITDAATSAPFNVTTSTSNQTNVNVSSTSASVAVVDRDALLSQVTSVPVSNNGVNRVSVGAFSNANNANGLANQLRAQGLPAQTQSSGNLTLVYVGPYASGSQATQVASKLKASGIVSDTQVYTRAAGNAAPAVTQPVVTAQIQQPEILTPNTSSGSSASSSTTANTQLTNNNNGLYLQVGAYRDFPASVPQRQRLESLGYVVFERVENNLVKLVVGPYRSDELVNVQSVLRAQGVDSFPTR